MHRQLVACPADVPKYFPVVRCTVCFVNRQESSPTRDRAWTVVGTVAAALGKRLRAIGGNAIVHSELGRKQVIANAAEENR
jgi:hypothetical protein